MLECDLLCERLSGWQIEGLTQRDEQRGYGEGILNQSGVGSRKGWGRERGVLSENEAASRSAAALLSRRHP
jgi:hypothetical protein